MNNDRILNNYKLLGLLEFFCDSYEESKRERLFTEKGLKREPFISKLIKCNKFSEIDVVSLKGLKDIFEHFSIDYDRLKPGINEMMMEVALGDFYLNLMNKLGVKAKLRREFGEGVAKCFVSKRQFNTLVEMLVADIDYALKCADKKIESKGVIKGKSNDDTLLYVFREKLSKCENLNDVESLLLTYTTNVGSDLINGFLGGDLTTIKSKNLKIKPTWGTDLTVSFNVLLDIAVNALGLRKQLMYGRFKRDIPVVSGTSAQSLINILNKLNKIKFDCDNEHCPYRIKHLLDYISENKPIYSSPMITSTYLDWDQGRHYALRHNEPVFMYVNIKRGTACGKDFRNTNFGIYDTDEQVVLAPNQKIKFTFSGRTYNDMPYIEGETI